MVALLAPPPSKPIILHKSLKTTFTGIEHHLSDPKLPIHQFLGIKYAHIPARFRQSRLFSDFSFHTDATKHGPICPQLRPSSFASDLLGGVESDSPKYTLTQSEFDCLNLDITRPGGHDRHSRLPVMVWFHGGWTRGFGSSWLYDGGALVRKSTEIGKPVILVTFNYRIGLFGNAASPGLLEDNEANGDLGVGNYGLRDQQTLLRWIHHFISEFGGDPCNVTLFGESTGASDILCHLYSAANETFHLFHRAIMQSPAVDYNIPDVRAASSQLSRIMTSLNVSTTEELRWLDANTFITGHQNTRVTDDGYFFRTGWKDLMFGYNDTQCSAELHHSLHPHTTSLPLQPVIIGDCSCESSLWSFPISYWTSAGVVRRIRAICQSLHKANNVLRAYDITSYTPEDELSERILDLINDTRFAWPIDCMAEGIKCNRGGGGVYRYIFDQESPSKGVPHHAADLIYLFDNVPFAPAAELTNILPSSRAITPDLSFSESEDEGDGFSSPFDLDDHQWMTPVVDEWSYSHVRDGIQERWIVFAHGQEPWHDNKAFVFGPEGETGERSWCIFQGRRRTKIWKSALLPLGLALAQKIGEELSNGPTVGTKASF